MRNLFLSGTKIFGLFTLYKAILIIPSIASYLGMIRGHSTADNSLPIRAVILMSLYCLISISFALILLFKTEMLANVLKIKDNEEKRIVLSENVFFKIGIILVGIFILAEAVPKLASTVYQWDRLMYGQRQGIMNIANLITYVLQIILALVLIIGAQHIVRFITKKL